jgi:hypothetical protein
MESWRLETAASLRGYTPAEDIPEEELQLLTMRVADAHQLAEDGKLRLGYALLLRGIFHAEQAVVAGTPWAGALMQCWREAIDDYCTRFDPDLEP